MDTVARHSTIIAYVFPPYDTRLVDSIADVMEAFIDNEGVK